MATSKPAVGLRESNGKDFSEGLAPRNLPHAVLPIELDQGVEKAYLDVFLFTETVAFAKIAVTARIKAIDIEDDAEAFPWCAARLVLQLQHAGRKQAASNTNLVALPTALACALQRRSALRRPWFVLQPLAGVPLPVWLYILRMASRYMCAKSCVAALEIARFAVWNGEFSGC
ncbi:MAG: hypothetical protein JWP63_5349 [Candidatus Solibacter sp.]|nr:hypothetical protein [Candidatus Solibacter sp.]